MASNENVNFKGFANSCITEKHKKSTEKEKERQTGQ